MDPADAMMCDVQARLARNPNDLDALEQVDLILNVSGQEMRASEIAVRLNSAWNAQGGRNLRRPDGGGRLDWVRLTGTSNDCSGISVGQYYSPHAAGFFTYYDDIKVFDPKLPPGSLLKRMFKLESTPDLGLSALLNGAPLAPSASPTKPAYFLREHVNDGGGGGGTHKNYGLTRPSVRQLLQDVMAAMNGYNAPVVSFLPGRQTQQQHQLQGNNDAAFSMRQLDIEITRIVPHNGSLAAMKILFKYFQSLVDHHDHDKYRKINTKNNAIFFTKVQPYPGTPEILRLIGFRPSREDTSFLVMVSPAGSTTNASVLQQTMQKLQRTIETMEAV